MVKVKVIKEYNDLKLKEVPEVGKVFETDKERAEYLIDQGMVEIIDKVKPSTDRK